MRYDIFMFILGIIDFATGLYFMALFFIEGDKVFSALGAANIACALVFLREAKDWMNDSETIQALNNEVEMLRSDNERLRRSCSDLSSMLLRLLKERYNNKLKTKWRIE